MKEIERERQCETKSARQRRERDMRLDYDKKSRLERREVEK